MSDRKYRQRGYQDEPREPRREQTPAQKKEYAAWAAARSAENLQHAGLPRGGAVRALRERVDGGHRVEPRRDVRAVRGGPAHLCPVCALRYERHLRVSASDPRAGLAEGRQEHVRGVRAEDHGRARDEVSGADQRRKAFDDLFK